ncbi:MAG: FtsB family cell division protein [Gammaproteobacteria bacterium]
MNRRLCNAATLLFAAGGVWLLYSAGYDPRDGAARAAKLRAEVHEHRRQNARLQLEIEEMRVLVREVKTDPSRLEEVARHRLQMIKKNEIFVLPAN